MPVPYIFSLDNLQINNKRNNKDYVDKDYVLFSVTVGSQSSAAPACTNGNPGYIGLANNGQTIQLGDNAAIPEWTIGPIPINDDDQLLISYVISNLSFNDDAAKNAATAIKLAGDVLSLYGSLGSVLESEFQSAAGIGGGEVAQALGQALNLISDIWTAIIGTRQDCDGLIALESYPFSGASLASEVTNGPLALPPTYVAQQLGAQVWSATTTNADVTPQEPPPGGCWTPSTNVQWTVFRGIESGLFPSTPSPGAQPVLRPQAVSLSPADWSGTWGDAAFIQNSKVLCTINPSGSGPTGSSFSQVMQSYCDGLRYLMQTDVSVLSLLGTGISQPRGSGFGIATVPALPHAISTGTEVVMPVTARYGVQTSESVAGSVLRPGTTITEDLTNLVELPMLVSPFDGNVYQQPSSVEHEMPIAHPAGSPGTTTVSSPPRPVPEPAAAHDEPTVAETKLVVPNTVPAVKAPLLAVDDEASAVRAAVATPLVYGATILVTNTISLQLYSELDAGGNTVGHRVRYSRSDGNGVIETDVMLAQAQEEPT